MFIELYRSRLLILPIIVVCGVGTVALRSSLVSDASAQDEAVKAAPEKAVSHGKRRDPKPAASADAAPAAAPATAAAAPAAAAPASVQNAPAAAKDAAAGRAAQGGVAARLRENGAGACAGQVDAVAAGSMGGVRTFNTVSNWSTAGSNDHLVSVAIGQRYADGTPVPYGATSVVAAPNGRGGCDAMAVQIVPSPLTCAKLRDTLSSSQRQAGDLDGIPVMQSPDGQTLLVPTGANTCVLVGLRTAYAP